MACSHQKLCYKLGDEKKVHFFHYFTGHDLDFLQLKNEIYDKYKGCYRRSEIKPLLIPCGQCVECRLQKAREMANRIYLEMLTTQTDVWSVTLTYDVQFLPYGKEIVDGNGELRQYPTLVPEHCSQFMKKLRQIFKRDFENFGIQKSFDGIKFYAAGEYGDDHGRPHMHFIIFNLPLPVSDVSLCRHEKSQTGDDLFTSRICEEAWSFEEELDDGSKVKRLRGRVRLNTVSWQYACYVARYIMKKQTGQGAEVYETLGIEPPFTRCSTKEGIGRKYYELHKDELLKNDCVLIKQGDRAVHVSLPHYFLRLAEKEGIDISKLKEKRAEKAQNALNICLFDISQDYFEYQRNLEQEKLSFQKRLPRVEF